MTKRKNRTIGISISESKDMGKLGKGIIHLQDAMVETARFLLSRDYNLAYGGDLNYDNSYNFTELLFQLGMTYGGLKDRITNYSVFPLYTKITRKHEADISRVARIKRIEPDEETKKRWNDKRFDEATSQEQEEIKKILESKNLEDKKLWGNVLTKMREKMTREIQCRIVIGGKTEGFKGLYPGVLEETILCVENNVTVIIDGTMGGVALEMVQGIKSGFKKNYRLNLDQLRKAKVDELTTGRIIIRGRKEFPDIEKYFSVA